MTTKRLSETHPTLWDSVKKSGWYNEDEFEENTEDVDFMQEHIQSCTVDIAEYERLKKELEEAYRPAQSVRLSGFEIGMKEGERRAMERVKIKIIEAESLTNEPDRFGWLLNELSLDKEVRQ